MEIKYVFTQKRRQFGAPCKFSNVGPHLILDIEPNPLLNENYVEIPFADKGTLCRGEMSVHEINTIYSQTESRGIDHDEGGWPADVDHRDDDQVARFKKKIEKDEGYIATIRTLGELVEKVVLENNAIDIYEEYFKDDKEDEENIDSNLQSIAVYRDYCCSGNVPLGVRRSVSSISWSADAKKLAVSYLPQHIYASESQHLSASTTCVDGCVWSIDNSTEPLCILKPDASVICLAFSSRDLDIIVGGYDNGQIALWDISKSDSPIQITPVEQGHENSVNGIRWINSKCGTEFISVSSDGQIISWDTRNLLEPTESMRLDPEGVAITCLEYDLTVPYRFMVGTDEGKIVCCNRRVSKDPSESKIIATFNSGKGPVLAIERNPYLPKLFFVASAFITQLWSEEHPESVLVNLISQTGYVTDAAWCPTRPSVLFQTKTTGVLEVWDVLVKRHEPTTNLKLENESMINLCFSGMETPGNRMVACGFACGALHLLELSRDYGASSKPEKISLAAMVDRETKREKLLEPKSREWRVEKQEEARKQAEIEERKELEIPDEWIMDDVGEDVYKEMEILEFGSGFLDKDDLEQDEDRRAEELNIEPEYGENRFLLQIERQLNTEKSIEAALIDAVAAVESDTSAFPLRKVSVESETGEKAFLEELKDYKETRSLLRNLIDTISEDEVDSDVVE